MRITPKKLIALGGLLCSLSTLCLCVSFIKVRQSQARREVQDNQTTINTFLHVDNRTAVAYLACDQKTLSIVCNSVKKLRASGYGGPVVAITHVPLVNTCNDIDVRVVEEVEYPQFMKKRANPKNHRYCRYTKFKLWTLYSFERVIYLDWDTWVVGSISELLNVWPKTLDTLAAVRDTVGPILNSGVMVLRPNKMTYDKLVKYSQTTVR